jgi:cyclase
VYVPEEKIAWTGNFVGNEHLLPMLLEVGPVPYIETLARCKASLDIDTIIPGHGPLGNQSLPTAQYSIYGLYCRT